MEHFIANIGVWSYGLAAVAYFVFGLMLVVGWRGRLQGGLLVATVFFTGFWALAFAYHAAVGYPPQWWLSIVDLGRHLLWLLFLTRLFLVGLGENQLFVSYQRLALIVVPIVLIGLALSVAHAFAFFDISLLANSTTLYSASYILLSVVGLVLLEQLFRNTLPEHRWRIKFLCIGIGGLFAYELFLYSDALMTQRVDRDFWDARGFVNAALLPLLAISAARNRHWSLNLFVSRKVVFHTATLVWAGVYLVAVSAGGYYVRLYGGSWGIVAQATVLFGAVVVLVILLFSGNIQARLRVFLNKHFYRQRYDYRAEWLGLTTALSSNESVGGEYVQKRAISALAEIADSRGGVLFLCQEQGNYKTAAFWRIPEHHITLPENDSLAVFLASQGWLVDLTEYRSEPELYGGLVLPEWLAEHPSAWVVVPLIQHTKLIGFVVLMRSLAPRELNWEDHDLLKTAGRQVAGYLALEEASIALANARQFEAFNRLSAYVVHDLKNVVGQLSLVVSNSKKFKDNQAFVDDAFLTVDNAVEKMQRMLGQLRQGNTSPLVKAVKLHPVVMQVIKNRSTFSPVAHFCGEPFDISVIADEDRLAAVIEHIVNNAQDATPDDGGVEVRLGYGDGFALIEIKDTGSGMSQEFIRTRLYKPFDTTKGNAGMGIGVYESQEFIQSLRGEIEVESEEGKGALFRLKIPAVQNKDDNANNMEGDHVE